MAGPTRQIIVIAIERPASRNVSEGRLFCGIVTFGAGVVVVATGTDGMDFSLRFRWPRRLIDIVAEAAVFLTVTVDASKAEQLDMFLVVESDRGAGLVWCIIDFFVGYVNQGMRLTHDIGGVVI